VTALLQAASTVLSVAGVIAFALGAVATRTWLGGLPVALELFLSAGLLRLSSAEGWTTIATAALLVIVRRVVVRALRAAP
jgi:hypothetical protein